MPSLLRLRAAAKVNLVLEVVGKRPDGYHELRSLFAAVSLYDELALERLPAGAGIEVVSEGSVHVPSGDGNLCHKAARFFFAETGHPAGVRIRVSKSIPVGAGMGGGSSDAAATLLGLSRLFESPLTPAMKARSGFAVGADVPFFLAESGAAWIGGIGEEVRPAPLPERLWLVMVHPGVFLSTGEVFAQWRRGLTKTPAVPTISQLGFREIAAGLRNDLETAARALEPSIGAALDALRAAGCEAASMTGSGSAVFGLFPDEDHARRAAQSLLGVVPDGWRVEALHTADIAIDSLPS
jgi:4-diphosphocytidyl-2-C-methyl-D-erythritol kinase